VQFFYFFEGDWLFLAKVSIRMVVYFPKLEIIKVKEASFGEPNSQRDSSWDG